MAERTPGAGPGSPGDLRETYVWDDEARARAQAALDEVEERHKHYPTCWACGQRTNPSPEGLCTRRTPEHDRLVAEGRWKISPTR